MHAHPTPAPTVALVQLDSQAEPAVCALLASTHLHFALRVQMALHATLVVSVATAPQVITLPLPRLHVHCVHPGASAPPRALPLARRALSISLRRQARLIACRVRMVASVSTAVRTFATGFSVKTAAAVFMSLKW